MSAPIEADVHQVSEGEVSRPHTLLYGLNGYQPKAGQLYQERPGKEKPPCRV